MQLKKGMVRKDVGSGCWVAGEEERLRKQNDEQGVNANEMVFRKRRLQGKAVKR